MTMKDLGTKIAASALVAMVSGAASMLAGEGTKNVINTFLNRKKAGNTVDIPDLPEPQVPTEAIELTEIPDVEIPEMPDEVVEINTDAINLEDGA